MQLGRCSFVSTRELVDTGIYAPVRHPLYLGWMLMYVVVWMFSPNWITAGTGIVGMACVYGFTRHEEQLLLAKFGEPYENYMRRVPRLNLLAGVVRRLGKGREETMIHVCRGSRTRISSGPPYRLWQSSPFTTDPPVYPYGHFDHLWSFSSNELDAAESMVGWGFNMPCGRAARESFGGLRTDSGTAPNRNSTVVVTGDW